ncbi:MAG: hypothetical protein ACLFQK_02055 [Fibrobacterota bacterium]
MNSSLHENYKALPVERLSEISENESGDYTEEAAETASELLKARGIYNTKPSSPEKATKKNDSIGENPAPPLYQCSPVAGFLLYTAFPEKELIKAQLSEGKAGFYSEDPDAAASFLKHTEDILNIDFKNRTLPGPKNLPDIVFGKLPVPRGSVNISLSPDEFSELELWLKTCTQKEDFDKDPDLLFFEYTASSLLKLIIAENLELSLPIDVLPELFLFSKLNKGPHFFSELIEGALSEIN